MFYKLIICLSLMLGAMIMSNYALSASVDLGESLLIPVNSNVTSHEDEDKDGLKDNLEFKLADSVKPLLVFDSDEANTLWGSGEPVTAFQVRPSGCIGGACERRCFGANCGDARSIGGLLPVNPYVVLVKYEMLWRKDGGYGPDSYCKNAHSGDNQGLVLTLKSYDGRTWEASRVNNANWSWPPPPLPGLPNGWLLEQLQQEWIRNNSADWEGNHVRIYLSAHKHHQYFNTALNHEDSVYSDYGCNDDVNGNGNRVLPNLISPFSDKRPNNVGEPEAHDSRVFISALDAHGFPGENVWSPKPFTGGINDSCLDTFRESLGAANDCETTAIIPWMEHSFSVRPMAVAEVRPVANSTKNLDVLTIDGQGNIDDLVWGPENQYLWTKVKGIRNFKTAPYSPVGAVARSRNKLDIFAVGLDGNVYSAAWEKGFADGWHGWGRILDLKAKVGSSISAVSRRTDWIDIFVVGEDDGVYTAAWNPSFTGGWKGWWRIGDLKVEPKSSVSVASRGPDNLDVFVSGNDGYVYTAAWDPQGGWKGWWRVLDLEVFPGSPISAVSSGTGWLDIFVVGKDGGIYTASWQPSFTEGWHGWWRIRDLQSEPGSVIGVVSRSPDKLDVVVTGKDGAVYTAAYEPSFQDGWHGWWRIRDFTVTPGTAVAVVSRDSDWLDVFVTQEGETYTAAWHPSFADGWHGWWMIPTARPPR